MSVEFKKPVNANYACSIVRINKLAPIKNADFIQIAFIFGNSVIVSKDVKIGDIGFFFPVECQLSHEFISNNNAYRKPDFGNKDPEAKPGFFDETRRIRCLKLRGIKSEGLYIGSSALSYLGFTPDDSHVGVDFDALGESEICRKYVPRCNARNSFTGQPKQRRIEDQIVDGQFRFHGDTDNLRRNIHQINPDDMISLSWKFHGSSMVAANVLVKRKLSWWEKALLKIGVRIEPDKYGFVWSSRKVVKGIDGIEKPGASHYYGSDIWGHVAKDIEPILPKGFTVYGEIVGYTPEGAYIQKDYDYGCAIGQHKFFVYRVTYTNPDGKVIEMPWPQMRHWCETVGLETVPHVQYGRANDIAYSTLEIEPAVGCTDAEHLLTVLEAAYVHDQDSKFCNNKVPEEGIVLRIDGVDRCRSFKLKAWRFLKFESDELDKGTVDIETEQSEGGE